MKEILEHNKPLVIIGSILILLVAVSFNIYFISSGGSLSGSSKVREFEMVGMPGADEGTTPTATSTQPASINFIPIIITAIVILAGSGALIVGLKISDRKKIAKEELFKKQLISLSQAMEAYGVKNGIYPISTTYKPEHYSGIHLGKEWLDYGFPSDEEMSQIATTWPFVDPDMLDKIIYYPKDGGKSFNIYAHISTLAKTESQDYNKSDELPMAWGKFNFKISSKGINQPAHQDHPTAYLSEPISAPASLNQSSNSGDSPNIIPQNTSLEAVTGVTSSSPNPAPPPTSTNEAQTTPVSLQGNTTQSVQAEPANIETEANPSALPDNTNNLLIPAIMPDIAGSSVQDDSLDQTTATDK